MQLEPAPHDKEGIPWAWSQWLEQVYIWITRSRPTLMTEASTSGTAVDFTKIPPWVKRITIMFEGVSTDGVNAKLVQIGDSGGLETTGYISSSCFIASSSQGAASYTSGFGIDDNAAANAITGVMVLTRKNSNIWIAMGNFHEDGSAQNYISTGVKSLSDTLTQVRITSDSTPDNFDDGSINVMYE